MPKPCPFCRAEVPDDARVCPHCPGIFPDETAGPRATIARHWSPLPLILMGLAAALVIAAWAVFVTTAQPDPKPGSGSAYGKPK